MASDAEGYPFRRKVRKQIFEDRDINHLSFSVDDPEETRKAAEISRYLLTANAEIAWMEPGETPLRAKVAQLSNLTCGHLQAPRIGLRWTRDAVSIDRAVIAVFTRGRGRVYLHPEDTEPEGTAFLIWPGTETVMIDSTMDVNEIIYVSLPANWLVGLGDSEEDLTVADEREAAALAPLCAFIASLCRLSPQGAAGLGSIRRSLEEVVKAMARTIVGPGEETQPTLLRRAMEVVLAEYPTPSLSAHEIANVLNVSVRKLQRAFEEGGTTAVAEVRKTRALAAHAIRAEQPSITTEELARQVGFGSTSSLFRALREQEDMKALQEEVAS